MASDDDLSDLSSLSSLSPVPSDDEIEEINDEVPGKAVKGTGILNYFPKVSERLAREPSPPPRRRSASPTHEYVLADNPDIAFIVMFRSRFSDAFPKSLANFGPQDIERDVVQTIPGNRVEQFLCAVLGLLLNRKQDVKPGHYGRALEDAIASHRNQWARAWEGKNPLSGAKTFNSMNPTQRLTLLRTLILWSLSSSETVKGLITQSYKQSRLEDDLNQPRSVQRWGSDADKRRYFLIEGQDDTSFRVYRESNPAATQRTWWSVASSIEDLKALADKLETKDGGPMAKTLARRIHMAMPRFEAGEDKRKRREYRQQQKERFKRPDPGFSMYEGRTRGKRIKYTYSDDEDVSLSDSKNRRSTRNTGTHTPADTGPVTTSSGRQIRAPTRLNVATGESAPNIVKGITPEFEKENSAGLGGRPKRFAAINHGTNGWTGAESRSRRKPSYDSEEEDESEGEFGDDEEDAEEHVFEESEEEDEVNEDEAMVENDLDEPRSLMVKLFVPAPKLRTALGALNKNQANTLPKPKALVEKSEVSGAPQLEMKEAPTVVSTTNTNTVEKKTTETPELTPKERNAVAEPAAPLAGKSLNPAEVPATSLAFRGSPEKPCEFPAAPPVEVSNRE